MFVFTGLIWKEGEAFSALCPELDVPSQEATKEEARKNLFGAASLHLEGSFKDGLPYLHPVPAADHPRSTIPADDLKIFKFKVDMAVRAYA